MTVDITALANVLRRLDAAATLKSFVVVFVPILVATNITLILAFFDNSLDLGLLNLDDSIPWLGIMIVMLLAAFAPFGFLLADWLSRQQGLRHLAACSASLLGMVGFALVGAVLATLSFALEEISDDHRFLLGIISAVGLVALALWFMVLPRLSQRGQWMLKAGFAIAGAAVAAAVSLLVANLAAEDQELPPGWWLGPSVYLIGGGTALAGIFYATNSRIVLSADVPRALLLGDVSGGFWVRCAFLAGLPSSLWHSKALVKPELWVLLLARPVVYLGMIVAAQRISPTWSSMTALLIGAAVVAAGHLLFYFGKRLAARQIWRPQDSHTTLAPILFLRSFSDDQLRFPQVPWRIIRHWLDLWSFRRNGDEAMIDEIARYGAVVALGQPGDRRVPFGAMRHYSAHADWQQVVTETARRATAIVIAAGESPGVLWEFELLRREGLLSRTLLLFRPTRNDDAVNRQALAAFQRITGIDAVDAGPNCELVALIHTRQGAVVLTARDATAAAYVAALRAHFLGCDIVHLHDRVYSQI